MPTNWLESYRDLRWQGGLEILILTAVFYYGYKLLRRTQGAKVLSGFLLVFVVALVASRFLELRVLSFLLQAFVSVLVLAFLILFQPEIRRALAEIGRAGGFSMYAERQSFVIEEVIKAIEALRERKYGALIVFEQSDLAQGVMDSGVPLHGIISEELLATIFFNQTPLHDGAVILRGDRLVAAGCILPVSQQGMSRMLGLRHRAALGLSEESDAVVLVLSEESGELTLCRRGAMERPLEIDGLRQRLTEMLVGDGEGVSWAGGVVRGFLRPSGGPRALGRRFLRTTICFVLSVIVWGVLGVIVAGMRSGLR
ncbi:MAG: diadenylate cyclase CdaA [Verrucomicrobia bacterium]|nr:diadenylate cyclase CdaA [Verrucomicrobiota bacterium]